MRPRVGASFFEISALKSVHLQERGIVIWLRGMFPV